MAKEAFTVFMFSVAVNYQTWAITVDIQEMTYEVARGDTITIPCTFKTTKTNFSAVSVDWTAHGDVDTDPDIEIISGFYPKNGDPIVDPGDGYQGRASLQYDLAKGIANLQLSSVTSKETRVFQCKVSIPGDKTGKLSDTTKIVVLVAPSVPECKIVGKAEYFQNINLTCKSSEGTPTPAYKWASYDVKNALRPNPLKSTDVNGVLSLYNISMDTSGYFICTSSNKIRSATCNLTLAVMPPSMNIASTAGIIGGVVAVIAILAVVICCCCCRKNKDNAEEYNMGVPTNSEYTDKEPHKIEEHQDERVESKPEKSANQRDQYEDRREQDYDHRSDRYSDRRDDYDDRRTRSNDRLNDRYDDRYDDRRSDRYDDRYDDRRSDRYDDRRSDRYDDRRSDRYDDPRNDRRDQYDDRYDDRPNYRRDR
ncbi:glycoprotein A33 (transmembrane), paralog a isoform X2 [Pygocentrus nattereri]|uniref:glycoprotein A33 (transmembrane), paralog a isoform X2 n=1 Tax=Pygocentrus nattereri TaxID=42514 RepID=UPI0018917C09|nr:glycoprotein A33 (transmembrane), paralog a isoform X2 [Pygocentrus nattereri]